MVRQLDGLSAEDISNSLRNVPIHRDIDTAWEDARRVLLQSAEPEHPVMQAMVSGQRDRFLEVEAEQRQRAGLPPFGRLAAVILSGPDPRALDELAGQLARCAPQEEGVTVLGPAPAPLAILRGRHRRRFLMKTHRDLLPQPLLQAWLATVKVPSQIKLQIDVDPYSFL